MSRITVGLLGASGETGGSIVNGLLETEKFDIIALTRSSSMSNPANKALAARAGVTLRPIDLTASQEEIIASLTGIEILISSIAPLDQLAQIPLATAAKTAGIKRFLPCAYMPIVPAGGVHLLRDAKESVYNHVKILGLPYTIVDVGWWYQLTIPSVPSGKTAYMSTFNPGNEIAGSGDVPWALTDLADIGKYVAKIVVDDRTVNKYVFVYNEIWSQNRVYELYARLTGEAIVRKYVGEEDLKERVAKHPGGLEMGQRAVYEKVPAQYMLSLGVRGDNQPRHAKYLGYLDGKEIYPELKFKGYEEYAEEVLEGKAVGIYAELLKQFREVKAQAES